MTRSARPPRRLAFCGYVLGCALWAGPAAAQSFGFAPLPAFAWPVPDSPEGDRWSGFYAWMSTGFEAVSSRRFGGYAGPTVGFEGGRMWREGPFVYGLAGGFDYLAAGGANPGFGRLAYTRDLAGAVAVKVGALLTPDVLLYARAGASAAHGTLRAGPTPASLPFAREGVAVGPEAGVGVEWAVTDRLTVGLEAGVVRRGLP